MNDEHYLYGGEFVDGVVALRYYREFETEEDAIRDLIAGVFFAKFDAIERWAGDNDSAIVHRHAWCIHDAFCEAVSLATELAALNKLQQLGEGRCWPRRESFPK